MEGHLVGDVRRKIRGFDERYPRLIGNSKSRLLRMETKMAILQDAGLHRIRMVVRCRKGGGRDLGAWVEPGPNDHPRGCEERLP